MLEYVCVCVCECVCVRTRRSGPKTWHVNSCGLVLHFLGAAGARSIQKTAVCVKDTHIMHVRTRRHTLKRVRGGAPNWVKKTRLEVHCRSLLKREGERICSTAFPDTCGCVCVRGSMSVVTCGVCALCVHAPVHENICVRACLCMCAQWCPAGGCSCRSCLCSQRVKG